MARKLEQEVNGTKADPIEISSKHNLMGFDPEELVKDVREIISLTETASLAGQPVSDMKKFLKAERGYHMGALAQCVKLERMEPPEARDWWLTVKTYAEHAGLDDPDLIDVMEGRTRADA